MIELTKPGLRGRLAKNADERRRRQQVKRFLGLGMTILGYSFTQKPGSRAFYLSTLGLAATWTTGGLVSEPPKIGLPTHRRTQAIVSPLVAGAAAFGVFYAGGLIARRIPALDRALADVMRYAESGSTPLVVGVTAANGAAEEIFFRGALFAAMGEHHPVAKSTAIYAASTLPTRNPALVLAAGAMGTLWSLQRRQSGGVLTPAVTHVTWSLLMLKFMPALPHKPVATPAEKGRYRAISGTVSRHRFNHRSPPPSRDGRPIGTLTAIARTFG